MVSGISNKTPVKNTLNPSSATHLQSNPVLERTPQADTVEAKKKGKLSKGAKWTIGVLGTAATLAATGLAIVAHKRNQIAKLYKEKLIISNLGENLTYQEASTVEEGIKYAKEVLKIKDVDSNFTLDAINEANRELVKVSNANKGQLFMPTALRYANAPQEKWFAHVNNNIKSNQFGELTLNGHYFEHPCLDSHLHKALFYRDGTRQFYMRADGTLHFPTEHNYIGCMPSVEAMQLIVKYYTSPSTMTIPEKRILFETFRETILKKTTVYKRAPISFLKELEANPQSKDFLESNNIRPDYTDLAKKTTKQQADYVEDILRKMHSEGKTYTITFDLEEAGGTIYHEMGHLQDFAKNLKELDLAKYKFSNIKRIWDESLEEAHKDKSRKKTDKYIGLDEIGNHWGSITSNKELRKMFNEKPEDFKKCYPDLYEFLTNQEAQQSAGKISAYAQSGIGEFIAEVYKTMIKGKQIPEDVKKLYEKFNGPTLP